MGAQISKTAGKEDVAGAAAATADASAEKPAEEAAVAAKANGQVKGGRAGGRTAGGEPENRVLMKFGPTSCTAGCGQRHSRSSASPRTPACRGKSPHVGPRSEPEMRGGGGNCLTINIVFCASERLILIDAFVHFVFCVVSHLHASYERPTGASNSVVI